MRTRIEALCVALAVASCTVPSEIRVIDARAEAGDSSSDMVTPPSDAADVTDVASDLAVVDRDVADSGVETDAGDSGADALDATGVDALDVVGPMDVRDVVDARSDTGSGVRPDVIDPTCAPACAANEACTMARTCVAVGTPTPIAPLSFAIMMTQRPRVRFRAPVGSTQSRVEFCRDASCSMVVTFVDVAHSDGAIVVAEPTEDISLDHTRRFWRVRAGTSGGFARDASRSSSIYFSGPGSAHASMRTFVLGYAEDYNDDGATDLMAAAGNAVNTGLRPAGQLGGFYLWNGERGGTGMVSAAPVASGAVVAAPVFPFAPSEPVAPYSNQSIGDTNGDGFTDFAWAFLTNNFEGAVNVWSGGALPFAAPRVVIGDQRNAYLSSAVALGDINGDGFADALVGLYGDGGGQLGRLALHLGSSSGLSTTRATTITPSGGSTWATALYGGDLDGDGVPDAIHSVYQNPTGTRAVDVLRGQRAAPYFNPAQRLVSNEPTLDDRFGIAHLLGDINDDGRLDLLVFARSGRTAKVFSQTAPNALSFETTPWVTLSNPVSTNIGWPGTVERLGDINNDGIADFYLGVSVPTESEGYVYLGQRGTGGPTMLTITAPSGDRPDPMVSAFFGGVVSGLADYNGDGQTDFALGAQRAGVGAQTNAGFVYLYSYDAARSTVTVRRRVDLLTHVSPANSPTHFGQGL